jgi:hypothetical protein
MSSTVKVIICTTAGEVLEKFVANGIGNEIEVARNIRDHIGFKFNEADTEDELHLDE